MQRSDEWGRCCGEARLYETVGLWSDGRWRCNLVLTNVKPSTLSGVCRRR
ncbi:MULTISPECIES: hypothetical protein [Cyanophyceae]|nr:MULTISPECIES: hypothetical protein [Cyanophyceae]MBD1918219.1 hypothetical protein [Phormidium sp. FACHB-77]MBD2030251.1 hypothetical protein [Phormidium sp. FACHB-322]MBD2051377.1 hypothetical protein [Leptolyngbya sp. FACHB-60]